MDASARYSAQLAFSTALPHQYSVGLDLHSDLPLLMLKGIGLQTVTSPAYFWDNQNRSDSQCVLQYTLQGCGAFELEGIHYDIRPGDLFLMDIPGPSRYYLPKDSEQWEFLFLEFTKECLPLLWKIYRTAGPVVHLTHASNLPHRMMEIYQMVLNRQVQSLFENAIFSYELWIRLTEYVVNHAMHPFSKIDYVKSFIDQHFREEELSLDQIAEHANLSKYYMCKEFRRKFGITPGKYIRSLRISEACRLLSTRTDCSLLTIAQAVGYANDNYFGKVFKAEKGVTPDQYRKTQGRYDFMQTICETPPAVPNTGRQREV